MKLNITAILEITNGTLVSGNYINIVECMNTDSRSDLSHNGLFIPIVGENVNGYDYIPSAIKSGAIAVLIEHPLDHYIDDIVYILVENNLQAMQSIGAYLRQQLHIPVVSITGSVGKTTTKELIYTAISSQLNCFKTIKNANSQIGVPKMMSIIDEQYELAILEAGMSMPNEMQKLANILQPNITVMTNIGVAHLENFSEQIDIFNEKFKLAQSMPHGSTLIVNGDDPILHSNCQSDKYRCIQYGFNIYNDICAENISIEDNTMSFIVNVFNTLHLPIKINCIGNHLVLDVLAAIAVAYSMKLNMIEVAQSFENYIPIDGRQLVKTINNITYIEDYYNANPDSMRAAIDVLSLMKTNAYRIAVLGDMKELGENEKEYHKELGDYVSKANVDVLVCVGELSKHIVDAAYISNPKMNIVHCSNNTVAANIVKFISRKNDIILLKASNSMRFNELFDLIFTKDQVEFI